MARHTIEIQETFDVPRSRVFALFADHQRHQIVAYIFYVCVCIR